MRDNAPDALSANGFRATAPQRKRWALSTTRTLAVVLPQDCVRVSDRVRRRQSLRCLWTVDFLRGPRKGLLAWCNGPGL